LKRDLAVFFCGILALLFCVTCFIPRVVPASSVISGQPVLILDAGHGGEDGGASSASGDKESDINLAIVKKTEALLAFLGIESILTRKEDVSIYDEGCSTLREKKVSDLKNRVKLIQGTPGAMVISVHQNTFTDPKYQGAQTFFGAGEISAQWGEYTQRLFQQILDPHNNRKATAVPGHVYLFQNIQCPALLVECGFLSNGEEASLLLTDPYQRRIALVLSGAYIHQLQMIPSPLGGG